MRILSAVFLTLHVALLSFSAKGMDNIKPGNALYVIDVETQHMPATVSAYMESMLIAIGAKKQPNLQKLANQLREQVAARKLAGAWKHGIVLSDRHKNDDLERICRDFVGSIMMEGNPYVPEQFTTVQLALYDTDYARKKTCVFAMKDGHATGEDGQKLPSRLEGEVLDLDDLGKVTFVPYMKGPRFDFSQPVQENFLHIPSDNLEKFGPNAYLQAVAGLLASRGDQCCHHAFLVQSVDKEGQRHRTRYARIAVPLEDGSFIPVEKVSMQFIRKVAPETDPLASMIFQIQFDDAGLAALMKTKSGDLDAYNQGPGLQQVKQLHELVGKRIAEEAGFSRYQLVAVTDMGKLTEKIRFPLKMLYTAVRENGQWAIHPPK